MDFTELLMKLPRSPGIYKMMDSFGNIIYVGKAKNLKNRISQYFRSQKNREPRIVEMIRNICSIEYVVTDTELDAFLEECRLIKELKPRYNRQLKNDGRYCYIKIPADDYPKIVVKNNKEDGTAQYFGPFTNPFKTESVVKYLNDFYPIRKCTSPGMVKRTNGCLFYQLGNCLGPCTGKCSPDNYGVQIEKISHLLNGKNDEALMELVQLQEQAAEKLEFEKAAKYMEYFLGLWHVMGKQRLIRYSDKRRNILAIESIDANKEKLFYIKGNRLIYSQVVDKEISIMDEFRKKLKNCLVEKFNLEVSSLGELTQYDIDEAQIIYSYIKKNRNRIRAFWIPSSRLNDDNSGLDFISTRIVESINTKHKDSN